MSKVGRTDYSCDICPVKESFDDDSVEPFKWKEVRFLLDYHQFDPIDICPACAKKMSSNKVIGRMAAIMAQAIESVVGGDK